MPYLHEGKMDFQILLVTKQSLFMPSCQKLLNNICSVILCQNYLLLAFRYQFCICMSLISSTHKIKLSCFTVLTQIKLLCSCIKKEKEKKTTHVYLLPSLWVNQVWSKNINLFSTEYHKTEIYY